MALGLKLIPLKKYSLSGYAVFCRQVPYSFLLMGAVSCANRAMLDEAPRQSPQLNTRLQTANPSVVSNDSSMIKAPDSEKEVEQLEASVGNALGDTPLARELPLTGLVNSRNLKHPAVQTWIRFFAKGEKSRFQRHLDRAEPYRNVVQEILVKNGVPADIFYLGIIESGYRSSARSTAQAVGVWQFIQPTGQRYGLEVNHWVDERQDIIRATEAAAKYLKDLHNIFNSWEFALAAYNTGEGRILRAILRAKTRDFWTLLGLKILPAETEEYVPKFIAAAYVYQNAHRLGFELVEDEEHPRLAIVEIPPNVRLSDLARISGLNPESLVTYNPHLLRGITPPNGRTYNVWVPRQHQQKVMLSLARQPRGATSLAVASPLGFSPALAGIKNEARREPSVQSQPRTSASQQASTTLRQATQSQQKDPFAAPPAKILASHQELGRLPSSPYGSTPIKTYKKPDRATRLIYARRGESLEDIARNHKVSIETLVKLNRLNSPRVVAGQELKVPQGAARPTIVLESNDSKKIASESNENKGVVHYRVQQGDSLMSIADRFGVSVGKLQKDNRLRRVTLFTGEVIKVESDDI